jgi:predicted ATPase
MPRGTSSEPDQRMTNGVIGRDEELASLRAFTASIGEGPAALVLDGEPGIGKTTLWREAVALAADQSLAVRTAAPAEGERKLSFSALSDLLSADAEALAPLLARPQARALLVALLLEDASPDAPADERAVGAAVVSALRLLAERTPVVVAIDDVQWLDAATASALSFAVRRLAGARVGFLIARRSERPRAAPFDLDRALPDGRVARLTVGSLSQGAVQRLLHRRLNVVLPRPLLLRLHAASGGNPFFALELARALVRRGASLSPGEPLPVPGDLRELVHERVGTIG